MGVAPGWYVDPENSSLQRWWDGLQWTTHTHAVQAPAAQPHADPVSPDVAHTLVSEPAGGLLHGGKKALEAENARLRAALGELGVTECEQIRVDLERLRQVHAETTEQLTGEEARARQELAALQAQVIATHDEVLLQEVGLYSYRHPLESSANYKDALKQVRDGYKQLARDKQAVVGATDWTVNGSRSEGKKMVREFSKLMLRAYNAEADHAVSSMKPYRLESAVKRLEKARDTISKLGRTMQIQVTDDYRHLRVRELELTADYLAKKEDEKEAERAERARLREEEKARKEYEREKKRLQDRLVKEEAHYKAALEVLGPEGDQAATAELEAELEEIRSAIQGVEERAANTRAGYVYIISNFGAFGERIVKIGMTRRLEPMDRVRELGDASVPFRYDTHALIFSEDAVALESQLHDAFSDRRVNLVNQRREFFYANPKDVREVLAGIDTAMLLSFEEDPEALEWRQSENVRRGADQSVEHSTGAPPGSDSQVPAPPPYSGSPITETEAASLPPPSPHL